MTTAARILIDHTHKVSVTQEHINKGIPRFSWRCPIALSIAEHIAFLTDVSGVFVNTYGATVILPKKVLWSKSMPYRAAKFIRDFHAGKPVSPFSFNVELTDNCTNLELEHILYNPINKPLPVTD